MAVIIRNKETGKVNSVCALCSDGDYYRWVSHAFARIFPGKYKTEEEAIQALRDNPSIDFEVCCISYEVKKG